MFAILLAILTYLGSIDPAPKITYSPRPIDTGFTATAAYDVTTHIPPVGVVIGAYYQVPGDDEWYLAEEHDVMPVRNGAVWKYSATFHLDAGSYRMVYTAMHQAAQDVITVDEPVTVMESGH